MERIIFDRRQSLCCKNSNVFRKYFKHDGKLVAQREGKYSRLYEALGINTPHFIGTNFSSERGMFFNDYCYVNMTPIKVSNFDEEIFQQISSFMRKITVGRTLCDEGVKFWNDYYRSDLMFALGFLKPHIDTDILLQKVYEQEISVVMHGDFSLFNMGLQGNCSVYLYDFASAGCAPFWWDWGYFIACLSQGWGRKIYEAFRNEDLLHCVKLASAVRFGRALRKNEDTEKRCSIFKYWSGIES